MAISKVKLNTINNMSVYSVDLDGSYKGKICGGRYLKAHIKELKNMVAHNWITDNQIWITKMA